MRGAGDPHAGRAPDKLIPVEIPGLAETRVLVLIDKVAQTPEGYPRGRGLPRKHPLGCKPVENADEEAV